MSIKALGFCQIVYIFEKVNVGTRCFFCNVTIIKIVTMFYRMFYRQFRLCMTKASGKAHTPIPLCIIRHSTNG